MLTVSDNHIVLGGGGGGGSTTFAGLSDKATADIPAINTPTATALNARELLSNKKTDVDANKTSDTFFPTVKAVFDWVSGLFVKGAASSVNNAVPTFDGVTGKLLKDSGLSIVDRALMGSVDLPATYEQKFTNTSNSSNAQCRISFENDIGGLGYYGIAGSNWSTYPPLDNGGVFFGANFADFNIFTQTSGKNVNVFIDSVLKITVSSQGMHLHSGFIDNAGSAGTDGQILKKVGGLVVWANP